MAGLTWVLEVQSGFEGEYKKRHNEIWPEKLETLKDTGISNYNILRHGLTLFGYFETDSLQATKAKLAVSDTNAKRGEWLEPIIKIEVDPTTQFPYLLPQQFDMS